MKPPSVDSARNDAQGPAAPQSSALSGIEAGERGEAPYQLDTVYEFRPLPNTLREVRRYADGQWLADDGEYDIAFIGRAAEYGAPVCLYIDPSYQRNIIASWCTDGDWGAYVRRHPRGNAWHYALRVGETDWGGDWGRELHPNRKAGDKGMSKMSAECGCSNGRGISPTKPDDPHILARLVRNRDTKAILVPPKRPRCMYCGDVYGEPNGIDAGNVEFDSWRQA